MDRQTAAQDRARWPGLPLAWLRERVTARARGVVLGAFAIAEAALIHPVLLARAPRPRSARASARCWG